jgi:hypothetical protein
MGVQGFISAQTQRPLLPNGLGMSVLARTLWNAQLEFDEIAEDYYRSAYGRDWQYCRDYLRRLSGLFDPPYLRNARPAIDPARAAAYRTIPGVVDAFRPVIERNVTGADAVQSASWRHLMHHADLTLSFARVLSHMADGRFAEALGIWEELKRLACEKEDALADVLDVYQFTRWMGEVLKLRAASGEKTYF